MSSILELTLLPTYELRALKVPLCLLVIFVNLLPAAFAPPPHKPLIVRPFASSDADCNLLESILQAKEKFPFLSKAIHQPPAKFRPCKVSADPNPEKNPQKYIQPGEVIAILSSSILECGSDEARVGSMSYYLLACPTDPARSNVFSTPHELDHIAEGHCSLRYWLIIRWLYGIPFAKEVTHMVLGASLDLFYVDWFLLLGATGSTLVRLAALLVALRWLYNHWRRRN